MITARASSIRWITGSIATVICATALAVTQLPEKLIGIWTTEGTTMKGDAVAEGQAIYLDIDGIGAMVSRRGGKVLTQRLVATAYSESAARLEVDLTQDGQVVGHLSLNFDAAQGAIVSPEDSANPYHRRKSEMSADVRAALGLESRPLSIPSVPVPVPVPRSASAASAVP